MGYQWTVYLLLAFVAVSSANLVKRITPQKGCGGGHRPMCCDGRNHSCQALGPQLNDASSHKCFCDSACSAIGDCCEDYASACRSVDCVLDHWAPFGACSSKCGWGIKQREKRIVVHAQNGGKSCGHRKERLPCYSYSCKVQRAHEGGLDEMRETGKIIPARYGAWRKNKLYNPYNDIRKNLFDHYGNQAIKNRPSYCAKYELVNTRPSCKSTFFADWAPKLQKGALACVECQPLAMKKKLGLRCRGHGVFQKRTRWNAVTVPGCHGEWVLRTRHENCHCDPTDDLSFILI